MESIDDLYRWMAHGWVGQGLADAEALRDPVPAPGTGEAAAAGGTFLVGSRLTVTVLFLRADGVIAFASAPLGTVAPDQVVGTCLSSYLMPAERAVVEESIRAVFRGREPPPCDLHGLLPQSQSRSYEARFAPVSREGQVVAGAAVIRDITERAEREDALRRERDALKERVERLSTQVSAPPGEPEPQPAMAQAPAGASRLAALCTLFDAVGEAAFISEAGSGRIVELNATACAWLKASREQVIGRTVAQLGLEFPLQPAGDGPASMTETRTRTRPLVIGGGRHQRGDRTAFAVEVSFTSHVIDERSYIVAVAREADVSERSQHSVRVTEWFYRTLFESTRDAVLLVARGGAIRQANPAALALFGYDSGGMRRVHLRDLLVDPGDVERFRAGIARAGVVRDLEVRLRGRDGRTFTGRLSAAAQRSPDHAPIQGYQCIIQADVAASAPPPEREVPPA